MPTVIEDEAWEAVSDTERSIERNTTPSNGAQLCTAKGLVAVAKALLAINETLRG